MFFSKFFSKFKNDMDAADALRKSQQELQAHAKKIGTTVDMGNVLPFNTSGITAVGIAPTFTPIEKLDVKIKKLKSKKSAAVKRRNHMLLTEAILKVLTRKNHEMNALQVFQAIPRAKLRNKETTRNSLTATLYYLESASLIERGSKRGTFKAKAPIQ